MGTTGNKPVEERNRTGRPQTRPMWQKGLEICLCSIATHRTGNTDAATRAYHGGSACWSPREGGMLLLKPRSAAESPTHPEQCSAYQPRKQIESSFSFAAGHELVKTEQLDIHPVVWVDGVRNQWFLAPIGRESGCCHDQGETPKHAR